jgi:sialate O-acetylesterase
MAASAQGISVAPRALRLDRVFGDGMVLQRGRAIPVWGRAQPGAVVSVTLGTASARATANGDGAWQVTLPARPAGGPYRMSVEAGESRVEVSDILVGDVWVASGQSNMELPVSVAKDAEAEIAAAHDPRIRELAIPHGWSEEPESEIAGGTWRPADPAYVGGFSAVGYYFARDLRKTIDVPIGIIHTSWGGSNIETWLSRRASGLDDAEWREVLRHEQASTDSIRAALAVRIGTLPSTDAGLVGGRAVWADPALDDSGWEEIPVPGAWERSGYAGMDGVGWLRTTFSLTEAEAREEGRLSLSTIDDNDITWVNGVEVGRTNGYNVPRHYTVPAAVLRPGRNVLTVRVEDGAGDGGIMGTPESVSLSVAGAIRPLAGPWRFRVGLVTFQPDGQRINKVPTVLYNEMVHPLLRVPIKGVIWYQGESNANTVEQAAAYRPLFAELIRSWRREWVGGGTFPFLWVQLPNYGAVDSVPQQHSAWATLRASQTAALALPATGQAITIDIGEPGDIHPKNKQEVGRRLALVARRVAYGETPVPSGPRFRGHTVRDGRVVVEFDGAGSGLVAHGSPADLTGFAIAGADRRWVRAQARLDGNRVVVWSDEVPTPVAVRYAWEDSPVASLFNRDGLPVAPFRTDRW